MGKAQGGDRSKEEAKRAAASGKREGGQNGETGTEIFLGEIE